MRRQDGVLDEREQREEGLHGGVGHEAHQGAALPQAHRGRGREAQGLRLGDHGARVERERPHAPLGQGGQARGIEDAVGRTEERGVGFGVEDVADQRPPQLELEIQVALEAPAEEGGDLGRGEGQGREGDGGARRDRPQLAEELVGALGLGGTRWHLPSHPVHLDRVALPHPDELPEQDRRDDEVERDRARALHLGEGVDEAAEASARADGLLERGGGERAVGGHDERVMEHERGGERERLLGRADEVHDGRADRGEGDPVAPEVDLHGVDPGGRGVDPGSVQGEGELEGARLARSEGSVPSVGLGVHDDDRQGVRDEGLLVGRARAHAAEEGEPDGEVVEGGRPLVRGVEPDLEHGPLGAVPGGPLGEPQPDAGRGLRARGLGPGGERGEREDAGRDEEDEPAHRRGHPTPGARGAGSAPTRRRPRRPRGRTTPRPGGACARAHRARSGRRGARRGPRRA
ncbi:hypothetical protein HRbin12_01541 [bacterium HR12]|nr:hypothetical protein HRbin12_01541 [bacterium HR12]